MKLKDCLRSSSQSCVILKDIVPPFPVSDGNTVALLWPERNSAAVVWTHYLILIIDILTVWGLISLIKIINDDEGIEWMDEHAIVQVQPNYHISFNNYLALSEFEFPSHNMIIMGKLDHFIYV